MVDNKVSIELMSKSQNEGFARVAVAAFVSQLDPTVEELTDVKTAVSEAVTNSIIHGYENKKEGIIKIEATISGDEITISIEDFGRGITNVEQAMEPLYTSKPELERSGMGFTVMETFMDSLEVNSEEGKGTKVVMKKKFNTVS
ncbi:MULTISPECIES: anti-sigma F factor [Clostridium]|uniref:Anti-sigma F factor n=1 Tax=Clostridium tertium TaxID=1559 RepID=A0A9X4B1N2_9CLOT|nr:MULTISPECIES: anti-sigma F factor [Clostridium]EEH98847.1 anti-sigma F factor [Clostridium sp. 7_2_43FAA]MBP1869531.1 stage II sporulation protein AB (anti-sigma F factor) [Clostridium tertium]MBS5305834.1 anti-sigma F factor [Clostridium sp.]MBS5885970.1 anti-sigma F factor [Clostridium sp.]MBU6136171.1 anti-sigma F factor [Clostridium tertium]